MLGEIGDLRISLSRTSAQLAIAKACEGHRGGDPAQAFPRGYSPGGRPIKGERAQDFPAQYDRRGASAQTQADEVRLDEDGATYTRAEFVDFYGATQGKAEWRAAGPQPWGGRPAPP